MVHHSRPAYHPANAARDFPEPGWFTVPEAPMVFLRFRSNEVRLACCDLARLRRRWGPAMARRISHRLQQLEAMTTVADLAFLPFDFYEHGGGVIEVTVAED